LKEFDPVECHVVLEPCPHKLRLSLKGRIIEGPIFRETGPIEHHKLLERAIEEGNLVDESGKEVRCSEGPFRQPSDNTSRKRGALELNGSHYDFRAEGIREIEITSYYRIVKLDSLASYDGRNNLFCIQWMLFSLHARTFVGKMKTQHGRSILGLLPDWRTCTPD
jgi:hypothetical protein